MDLVDTSGRRIAIEKERFRGGEGTIHPVIGNPNVFAKLYHQKIDSSKQVKLAAMTTAVNDSLVRIAAWPTSTLHAGAGGRMVGFLMPRFDGQRSELHDLYRPGTRKQLFRQADWSFLIHAARNVAAAVATVHAAGHVVGDVNQRNFIVGQDATVKVLDCDSFQIRAADRVFRCVVGVPEFTPPELQNTLLDSIDRTPNHDAFGLAVLVFQLLFMGRHPFAGRFQGAGEMPIERAIAEGRFAFGRSSKARLMEPPPGLIAFECLPPRLAALFEAAFGPAAMRPGAKQWTDALDAVKRELRTCASEPMHKYYVALPQCSWCALERGSGVYYFIGVTTAHMAVFDLAKWWADVVASTSLSYEAPVRPVVQVVGTPVPAELKQWRIVAILAKFSSVLLLAGIAVTWPDVAVLAVIAIVVALCLRLPGRAERKRREEALREAERWWHEAYRNAEHELTVAALPRKRAELQSLAKKYETIDAEKAAELADLKANAYQIQLKHFLERYLIRTHDIPDVGPKRKATLAAWGIDTAADVTWQSLRLVQGFGPTLQARLMAWRSAIESRFVFDAQRAIPRQDLDAIDYRWRRRKSDLEQQLRAGAEEARRMNAELRQRRVKVAEQLRNPARDWAQALADVEAFRQELG